MSKSSTRNAARRPRPRPSAQKSWQRRRARSQRTTWIVLAVVIVIGVSLVAAVVAGNSGTSKSSGSTSQPAPAALVQKVTSVPASVLDQVGAGSVTTLPKSISAPALTTPTGTPRIVYMGAEYCPYCAAERWGMLVALSRFGTFTGLRVTRSASNDVDPNTQTFSFHGSSYQSTYLSFEPVELETNQLSNGSYTKLDTPTAEQQKLIGTYDVPPNASSAGAIPFIDFGGKYLVSGASYDPGVLQGKSADAIATALSDPSSAVAKGAVGTANVMTAAICTLTHDQPATVCSAPAITNLQQRLK
ncbi:MAG TPA: DUF929 family protein [Acidimicrobiia bacterium]|jgi:hypothetical protein